MARQPEAAAATRLIMTFRTPPAYAGGYMSDTAPRFGTDALRAILQNRRKSLDRRELLKSVLGGTVALGFPSLLQGQIDKWAVMSVGETNVVVFPTSDGLVLVDSGAPNNSGILYALTLPPNSKITSVFNTHYHLDNTGNNEQVAALGAKIVAHEHTRQWMSTDYWVPDEVRYEKARPKAAQPIETFRTTGSLKAGSEQIDYGHLPLAHTDGDIYVHFKTSNVLAVGDVASPLRDPSLDYFTGAWIGGRVDAMDVILMLSSEQTMIVPAAGLPMTRAEFKAERDLMEEVRSRVWKRTIQGDSPREMLEAGVMNGLPRTWKDPYKFLYDVAKGMFAHHNKLDPAVI
jgi:glyoxylase-like metal-dependent hydrolase (beta-lactamase superfamily II)